MTSAADLASACAFLDRYKDENRSSTRAVAFIAQSVDDGEMIWNAQMTKLREALTSRIIDPTHVVAELTLEESLIATARALGWQPPSEPPAPAPLPPEVEALAARTAAQGDAMSDAPKMSAERLAELRRLDREAHYASLRFQQDRAHVSLSEKEALLDESNRAADARDRAYCEAMPDLLARLGHLRCVVLDVGVAGRVMIVRDLRQLADSIADGKHTVAEAVSDLRHIVTAYGPPR